MRSLWRSRHTPENNIKMNFTEAEHENLDWMSAAVIDMATNVNDSTKGG